MGLVFLMNPHKSQSRTSKCMKFSACAIRQDFQAALRQSDHGHLFVEDVLIRYGVTLQGLRNIEGLVFLMNPHKSQSRTSKCMKFSARVGSPGSMSFNRRCSKGDLK